MAQTQEDIYSYPTPPSQQRTTPDGAENQAANMQEQPDAGARNIWRNVTLPNLAVSGTDRSNKHLAFPASSLPTEIHMDTGIPGRDSWYHQSPSSRRTDEQLENGGVDRTPMHQGSDNKIWATEEMQAPYMGQYRMKGYNKPADQVPVKAPIGSVETANDPNANKSVVGGDANGNTPTDGANSGNGSSGNPLIDKFNQEQEKQGKKVPTSKDGGKGLTGWLKRNFGNDGTPNGKRRALQNITALTQMLRHAVNLYGVSKHAYNQQIDDQFSKNEARFKQEDAEQAARDKAQKEWERQLAKDKADADYKTSLLGYKERDAKRADADLERKKAADADNAAYRKKQGERADAELQRKKDQDTFNNNLNTEKFEEQKKNGAANRQHMRNADRVARGSLALREREFAYRKNQDAKKAGNKTFKGTDGKTHEGIIYTTPQGSKYYLSKSFTTSENVRKMYYALPKRVRDMEEYAVPEGSERKDASYDRMLNAVLFGANEGKPYHDYFVKIAGREGYSYEGGMSDALYAKLIGKPRKHTTLKLK